MADEIRIVQRVLAWEGLPDLLGDTAGGSGSVGIWWTSAATWLNYMTKITTVFVSDADFCYIKLKSYSTTSNTESVSYLLVLWTP